MDDYDYVHLLLVELCEVAFKVELVVAHVCDVLLIDGVEGVVVAGPAAVAALTGGARPRGVVVLAATGLVLKGGMFLLFT